LEEVKRTRNSPNPEKRDSGGGCAKKKKYPERVELEKQSKRKKRVEEIEYDIEERFEGRIEERGAARKK